MTNWVRVSAREAKPFEVSSLFPRKREPGTALFTADFGFLRAPEWRSDDPKVGTVADMGTARYDYIIIGSGIAGLNTALLAAEHGSVLVVTKGRIDDCNSRYAQGGIAAAIGPGDSATLHERDTLDAGAGLCDPEAVRALTGQGADSIAGLIQWGVPFDTIHGRIALGREGAHSMPRILHAGGDATGMHIEDTLADRVRGSERITVLEYTHAIRICEEDGAVTGVEVMSGGNEIATRFDRLTVSGSAGDDVSGPAGDDVSGSAGDDVSGPAGDDVSGSSGDGSGRQRRVISGGVVVVSTGGAGRLYRYTTNPEVATGDGVALAYLAGAEVMDMEFYQFHPTALWLQGAPTFLLSEAMRGEGAVLRNADGEPFMSGYHPMADLAPRDVVSRAIAAEMERADGRPAMLDISHLPAATVTSRFPTIYAECHPIRAGHHPGADTGRARGPLHDGRRAHRHLGSDERPRPLRLRRGGLRGGARRQPAGQQLVAGYAGFLPAAGGGDAGKRAGIRAAV